MQQEVDSRERPAAADAAALIRREHARLDAAATELEMIVIAGAYHLPAIFSQLHAFDVALAEHLLREAYLTASAAGTGEAARVRHRLDHDLRALQHDWDEYLGGWTEETAAVDWDLFAEHSVTMLARVRRRIHRENAMLLIDAGQPG